MRKNKVVIKLTLGNILYDNAKSDSKTDELLFSKEKENFDSKLSDAESTIVKLNDIIM